jgi:hypothetical protein
MSMFETRHHREAYKTPTWFFTRKSYMKLVLSNQIHIRQMSHGARVCGGQRQGARVTEALYREGALNHLQGVSAYFLR